MLAVELSILVLEDDLTLQRTLVEVLDDFDYSAYGVGSAAEAIAAVQEAEPIKVIFSQAAKEYAK